MVNKAQLSLVNDAVKNVYKTMMNFDNENRMTKDESKLFAKSIYHGYNMKYAEDKDDEYKRNKHMKQLCSVLHQAYPVAREENREEIKNVMSTLQQFSVVCGVELPYTEYDLNMENYMFRDE